MRVSHLAFVVLLVAVGLVLARDAVGRVALVVFIGGALTVAVATTSTVLLFRSLYQIGSATSPGDYLRGLISSLVVLAVGAAAMAFLIGLSWAMVRNVSL